MIRKPWYRSQLGLRSISQVVSIPNNLWYRSLQLMEDDKWDQKPLRPTPAGVATETRPMVSRPGRSGIGTTVISSNCGPRFTLEVPISAYMVSIAVRGRDLVPMVRPIPSGGRSKTEEVGIDRRCIWYRSQVLKLLSCHPLDQIVHRFQG